MPDIIPRRSTSGLAGGLAQTEFAELSADVTTNSPVLAPFLSLSITTAGGDLCIWFAVSASNNTNNVHSNLFALFVDGVQRQTAGFSSTGNDHAAAVAIVRKVTGVAAGPHTVEVQWSTNGGVLSCTPIADPDESATLLVFETTT